MRVKATYSMTFNLEKCIGCNTCTVACKNVWTNREGAEYMWWNNVETKPGIGYPKRWENQDLWKGGWDKNGNTLGLNQGGKSKLGNPSTTVTFQRWLTTTARMFTPSHMMTSTIQNRGPSNPWPGLSLWSLRSQTFLLPGE